MNVINYISNIAMPMAIVIIIIYGLKEKIKVFDVFLKGAKEGISSLISVAPSLIGLVIGALPGLSGTMAVAIFTPLTFWFPPAAATNPGS